MILFCWWWWLWGLILFLLVLHCSAKPSENRAVKRKKEMAAHRSVFPKVPVLGTFSRNATFPITRWPFENICYQSVRTAATGMLSPTCDENLAPLCWIVFLRPENIADKPLFSLPWGSGESSLEDASSQRVKNSIPTRVALRPSSQLLDLDFLTSRSFTYFCPRWFMVYRWFMTHKFVSYPWTFLLSYLKGYSGTRPGLSPCQPDYRLASRCGGRESGMEMHFLHLSLKEVA